MPKAQTIEYLKIVSQHFKTEDIETLNNISEWLILGYLEILLVISPVIAITL